MGEASKSQVLILDHSRILIRELSIEVEEQSLEKDAEGAVVVPDIGHPVVSLGYQGMALFGVDDQGKPVVGEIAGPLVQFLVEESTRFYPG